MSVTKSDVRNFKIINIIDENTQEFIEKNPEMQKFGEIKKTNNYTNMSD